jgi:hypothetical protein
MTTGFGAGSIGGSFALYVLEEEKAQALGVIVLWNPLIFIPFGGP